MVRSLEIFRENLRLFVYSNVICFLRHSSSSAPSFSHRIYLDGHYPLNFQNDERKHEKPISASRLSAAVQTLRLSNALRRLRLSNARESFDEMPKRDGTTAESCFGYVLEVLRSSVTRADAKTVRFRHCLALKTGVVDYLPASSMLLKLYSRAGDVASSWALFGELNVKDVIVWNSLITVLIQNDRFAEAACFFVHMIEEGNGFDSTTLLLVASALANLNWVKQGRSVHGLGIKAGLLSDSSLCNALMNLYAKLRDLDSAERVFADMEYRDIVSWNTILTGCLGNDHPGKCLQYFEQMTCLGRVADNVSFSCVVSASTCLEELRLGESFHGLAKKLGYSADVHVSVANALISLYSRCGDIEAAETVFVEVLCKDVVSWNAIIDGFASNGMFQEAFDLLREMQFAGSVQPDIATVVLTISLCAALCLSREGKAIHGYTVRRRMQSGALAVTNSHIDMYAKCGSIRQAELLFKTAAERDLVSWNSMISAYAQNDYKLEAMLLFKELLCSRSCSEFSLSTVLAILPSCDSSNSLAFGKSIHCWQLKLGFGNNLLSANSLMKMYISCGDLAAAFLLLETMSQTRDVASWNTAIYGCASKGHHWESLRAFQEMRNEGKVRHDLITLLGTISACGNLGLAVQGRCLHGLAVKTLMESDAQLQNTLITMYGRCRDIKSAVLVFGLISDRNLCSWNSVISALSQNKAGREAFELFMNIEFEPNEITIVGLLSASTQLGFTSYGMQIHCHLIRRGFQDNPFVSAAIVDMYSNCGRLEASTKVFRNSEVKSVAAWNSMISAYGFHGNAEKAREVFREMSNFGMKPNQSTFVSLLSACSHSGFVEEGLWYYNQMEEKYGVKPVTEHHVCVVDMLGRSGRLREAYELIRRMPGSPQPGVWGALLSACNYHGDTETGNEVAEILFQLEPENAGYYISLANAYVGAGRWREAVRLRRIVEQRGLKKLTGCSVIDVGFG